MVYKHKHVPDKDMYLHTYIIELFYNISKFVHIIFVSDFQE